MKRIPIWLTLIGLLLLGCNPVAIQPVLAPVEAKPTALPAVATLSQAAAAIPGPTATPLPATTMADARAEEALLINIYERVSPAVVHVEVTGVGNFFAQQGGAGSGFVIDGQGHIVTNNHVVESATRITAIFADGTHARAKVVGADPAIDLAIIQVNVPANTLVPVELGNSDTLKVGQRAIAIGNPFRFDQSMTAGIISALGRVVEPNDNSAFFPDLIQTDAAINPGNSGGPLLDSHGQVIGINTLIFSETGLSTGIGFAIPVNTLKRALPVLLESRQVGEP